MRWAAATEGPAFIRVSRMAVPAIYDEDYEFVPGRAITVRTGDDVTIISNGTVLWRSLAAAEKLAEEGISARVISMPTVKPLDVDAVIAAARETKGIVTAEEATTAGGLGGAVAETVVQHHPTRMTILGVPGVRRHRFGRFPARPVRHVARRHRRRRPRARGRMTESFRPPAGPRFRVISDNDYAGDPDGLYQLAHHALSPSVELRAVIGSHLAVAILSTRPVTARPTGRPRRNGCLIWSRPDLGIPVIAGSELPLISRTEPQRSAAAEAIVAEAMRTDTDQPLYVVLGAGLTELASAYLIEPAIADQLIAVWIGGPEHLDLGAVPPPNAMPIEYNLNIDLLAGQVIFDSPIPLWQVPRNTYRECLASMTELIVRVKAHGALGEHLYETLIDIHQRVAPMGLNMGETYVLGDSPLVLLTALQTGFEADPASSAYDLVPRPRIGDDGAYVANPDGHPIRVYSGIDVRLMLEDLYAKLELAAVAR